LDSQYLRPETDGAVFHERLRGTRLIVALLVPVLLLATVALVRASGVVTGPTAVGLIGAQSLDPADLTAAAADRLEDTTKAGGTGYRFQIVQTSTMVAKADGPRIEVPDPITGDTLKLADSYFLNSVIELGVVRPEGFWSQMRAGPTEGGSPDWKGAQVMYEALLREGERWRSDGDGWYQTDGLPGIGLDPETAALLPALLREATAAKDLAPDDAKIDPSAARNLEAAAAPADIPGLVASDGLAFTELLEPLAYAFDDTGRLIGITAVARNLNMTEHDLIIETTISIAYDNVDPLPEPKPLVSIQTEGAD